MPAGAQSMTSPVPPVAQPAVPKAPVEGSWSANMPKATPAPVPSSGVLSASVTPKVANIG